MKTFISAYPEGNGLCFQCNSITNVIIHMNDIKYQFSNYLIASVFGEFLKSVNMYNRACMATPDHQLTFLCEECIRIIFFELLFTGRCIINEYKV